MCNVAAVLWLSAYAFPVHQEEESERKRRQELDSQLVASKMEELKTAKTLLEQEVSTHKKRLHMEAQATRQVRGWMWMWM